MSPQAKTGTRSHAAVWLNVVEKFVLWFFWSGPQDFTDGFCALHRMNILITFWIIFPHPGQGAWNLCSLLAHGKQVSRWAVRPCIIFPLRGRTRQSLQGSSSASGLTSSTSMPRFSWLSPSESCSSLWKTEGLGPLPFPVTIVGNGRSAVECEGRMTGSETVLLQSGTSMPVSLSSSSSWVMSELHAGMSGTEREWASRGTSLYQFFLRAQHRTQYLWRGMLYFRHSVHCHAS